LEAALHQETAQAALRAYAYEAAGMDMSGGAESFLESAYLRSRVIRRAGKAYLDHSMIDGGSNGVHIAYRETEDGQDAVDVLLSYRVRPIVDILGFAGFSMGNRCRMKAWTGYRTEEEKLSDGMEEEMVYITQNGRVYHKSRNCSYLSLSIRAVDRESLGVLRNGDGGKYYPCKICGKGLGGQVFLTDEGNRYHSSLMCSGLKRTIYVVSISQVGGRGACSRCCAVG